MIKDTTKSKQPKGLFFVFGCFTKETQKKKQKQKHQCPQKITSLKHKHVFVRSDERITLEAQMKLVEVKQNVTYNTKKAYEILQSSIWNDFVTYLPYENQTDR